MSQRLVLIVLLGVSSNGTAGHLLDLVSGAHDRVHSAVHGAATSVLGGLNFNIAGQLGVSGHRQQQPPPQRQKPETVIVVVEEQSNGYGQGSYGRPNQYENGNNGPPPPGHHGPPPQNNNGQNNYNRPPMNNYGMPLPNMYVNYYGQNNPMQGDGSQNQNNYGQNQNDQTTQGHGHQNQNHNNYGQNDQTSHSNQNHYGKPTQGNNNQNNYGTSTQGYNQNTSGADDTKDYDSSSEYQNKPVQKPKEQTTKKPDDGPLFVPLNPNEYVYGGDKISVGAPKRDTDNAKPSVSEDEDLPIDIRFQDDK